MTPVLSLWPSASTKNAALKIGKFISESTDGCGEQYLEVFCDKLDSEQLSAKLTDSYRRLIQLTMADTTLHVVAVAPLYDVEFASQLQLLQQAFRASSDKLSLHIVGLRGNLSRLFGEESDAETEKRNIELLDQQSFEGVFPYSFTIIDDYASNGASLAFTLSSFSEYLALLFSALIRHYYQVLQPALLVGDHGRNIAIGLSSMRFDLNMACRALLSGAFLGALDKVAINQEQVDVNVASQRATKILHEIDKCYPRFFERVVLPQLHDENKDASIIAADAAKPLAEEVQKLDDMLMSVLNDSELSFPEKEAVWAMILGRDNPRLHGALFSSTVLLDDACSEPLNRYIKAFNDNVISVDNTLPVRGDYETLKLYTWNETKQRYEESPENERAFDPLPEIKRLKREILDQTAYIRQKEAELAMMDEIADDKRAVANEGTITERQGLAESVKEQPLDQIYVPSASVRPKKSVDLRKFFSPVKSQGRLGACSTFAVVSMYEAIMNRFAGENQRQSDLSERFVYYYSNIINGKPEGGSNYFEQLRVLGMHGVCEENLFSYNTSDMEKAPTEEAVENARYHRVLQAMQIPLQTGGNVADRLKRNHELMTTALSEGFPVGISLKIYDSFGRKGQFINRPDEDDISSGGEGHHAMVLAGYSDAEKCYIVRNSWGDDFGDKGYAYVSAAYIDDPEYNSFACIITQTTESEHGEGAEIPQLIAAFAGTESQIRAAAIRNALDEAYVVLKSLQETYEELYKYYQQLVQRLCMPKVKKQLQQAAETACSEHVESFAARREDKLQHFVERLKEFKRGYLKSAIGLSAFAFVWDLSAVCALIYGKIGWGTLWVWIVAGIFTFLTVLTWINYRWAKKRKHRELNEELADLAAREARARTELREVNLRFHVSGMWLDKYHELSLKMSGVYDRFVSYNRHLHGWYVDEQRKISEKPERNASMFIYYEDYDLLKDYFNEHAHDIIARIDLISTFNDYVTDKENIQQAHERLEKATLDAIIPLFSNFSMPDYLLGRRYAYLRPLILDNEISRLLSVGQVSVRHNATAATEPQRMVMANLTEGNASLWKRKVDPCLPAHPVLLSAKQTGQVDLITVQPLPVQSLR